MTRKVAVVDDNSVARTWIRSVLSGAGFEVVEYARSFGIQAFIRQTRPSVLILDVNMPALSGNVICSLLKENADTREVLIILYSAAAADTLQELAASCKADGWLRKSNDPNELVSKVKSISLLR